MWLSEISKYGVKDVYCSFSKTIFLTVLCGFENSNGAASLIILPRPDGAAEVPEAGAVTFANGRGKKNILKGHMYFSAVISALKKNTSLVYLEEKLLFMKIRYKIKSFFVT